MFNTDSIATQTRREFGGNVTALCTFYRFYYRRIWQKQPGRLLEKVTRQMLMFYVPYCGAYDPRLTRNLGDQYQHGVASLSDPICRKVWSAYSPAVDFMTRTEELARRGLRFQEPVIVPLIVFLAAISYSIWLVIALVLASIVATHFRQWGRLRFIAAFVVFAFSFNAACCLEVAIINSLEVSRYLTVQMFSTLFAQLLGLWFILEFVVQMCERPMERVFRLAGPGNEP